MGALSVRVCRVYLTDAEPPFMFDLLVKHSYVQLFQDVQAVRRVQQ